MYNNSYDDYIRSVLGYPNNNSCNDTYDFSGYTNNYNNSYEQNDDLNNCYPEIYKIIYPMVVKACRNNNKRISREDVEDMTNEIYLAIETDNTINLNINLNNKTNSSETKNPSIDNKNTKKEVKQLENRSEENRGENRQFANRSLRDLIKILILRELIGGTGNFPSGRPPMPPPPPRPPIRPPFPGGPGPVRPPVIPREYDIYEF